MEETELRTRLESLAVRTAPLPMDADDLAAMVIAGAHAGRRRQWQLAAMTAAVVAVLVSVPVIRSALDRDSEPAAPGTTTGVYTGPTRGDLAEDLNFVQVVRRLPWAGGPAGSPIPEPPVESRHVVFVGHVPNAVWALVAGSPPGAPLPPDDDGDGTPDLEQLESVAIAWFAGPYDASAGDMTLQSVPRVVRADQPTALTDRRTTFSVVVAAPSDRIEVCTDKWIELDGEVICGFREVYSLEGVAYPASTIQASIDRVTRYRVVRDGIEFTGTTDAYPDPDFVPAPFDVARLRPAPAPAPGDAAIDAATDEFLSRTGLPTTSVDFTVVWAGDLPMGGGGTARLSVVAAELKDGGVWVTGTLGWDAGDGQVATAFCGSEIRPAGIPLEEQFFVLRCDDSGDRPDIPTDSYVVVAPPEAAAAHMWHDDELVGASPLTDGVAVFPDPGPEATVEILDRDGRSIDRQAPMGTADFGG
jgi:hypothetical protein